MLKSLLIKIVAKVVQFVGLIYRPRKQIEGVKTILLNKADRIGDAIVVLPFLLELKKYFQITVLTTKRNNFIFEPFFKTEIILEKPRYIYEEIMAIIEAFFMMFKKTSKSDSAYDLYLDLNGIRQADFLVKFRKEHKCRYYAGLNSGPFNILLDYAHKSNSMLFSKKHILETFQEIIKESLKVDIEIPDYIDLTSKMMKPEEITLKMPFIMINIAGAKNFRGPCVKLYTDIIKGLSAKKINFLIIDELNRPNLKEFQDYLKDNTDRIMYIDKDLSLWQLLYMASKSSLYVGADSGITHFLSIPTNAVIFFGTGLPGVWRPYSKNIYIRKKNDEIIVEETKTSKGLIKKIIYKPVWCRPCFDIGCNKINCIRGLLNYEEAIIKEIEEAITNG
ncbi:MAG: hypothetical protein PHS93_05835 [Candidatus Omnitrophica bacterium]|nr:hypothetical protein [Candidatus Omnitrophota bacterium]MDD5352671.1 hypothetical protein [Candidatus Omnitrophota bacterium]MDD5550270.1 hypothetical protein [Candidatus Omnitrophota bacterium]